MAFKKLRSSLFGRSSEQQLKTSKLFYRSPRDPQNTKARKRQKSIAKTTLFSGTVAVSLAVFATAAVNFVAAFPEVEVSSPTPNSFAPTAFPERPSLSPGGFAAALPDAGFVEVTAPVSTVSLTPVTVQPTSTLAIPVAANTDTPQTEIEIQQTPQTEIEIQQAPQLSPPRKVTPDVILVTGTDLLSPLRDSLQQAQVYVEIDVDSRRSTLDFESIVSEWDPVPPPPGLPTSTTLLGDAGAEVIPTSTLAPVPFERKFIVLSSGGFDFNPDAYATGVQRVSSSIPDDVTLIWINQSSNISPIFNEALAETTANFDNVFVADWKEFSAGRTQWFSDSSNQQLSEEGADAYARFILAALYDPGVAV